jgi:hypothetical protein
MSSGAELPEHRRYRRVISPTIIGEIHALDTFMGDRYSVADHYHSLAGDRPRLSAQAF